MMGREPSATRRGGGRGPHDEAIPRGPGDTPRRSRPRPGPSSRSRGMSRSRPGPEGWARHRHRAERPMRAGGRGAGVPLDEKERGGTTSYTPHPTRCGGADGSEVSSEMLEKERECIPKQSLCPLLHRHKKGQQYTHSVQL